MFSLSFFKLLKIAENVVYRSLYPQVFYVRYVDQCAIVPQKYVSEHGQNRCLGCIFLTSTLNTVHEVHVTRYYWYEVKTVHVGQYKWYCSQDTSSTCQAGTNDTVIQPSLSKHANSTTWSPHIIFTPDVLGF